VARLGGGFLQVTTISLRREWPLLLLFVGGIIGIGMIVGLVTEPGGDYLATLEIPDLILPAWLSTAIWLLLCLAFAIAGWRHWLRDSSSVETRLWLAVLILSWWYSPAFFVVRSPLLALIIILFMAALMLVFILRCWTRERISALLFIPCFLWVAYAAAMTAAIVAMN
jgi:benzodiazapine receptor